MDANQIYADAREQMKDVVPTHSDSPPRLRDFLLAGMPEWMAAAAADRLRLVSHYADDGTAEEWWAFVRAYAASGLTPD